MSPTSINNPESFSKLVTRGKTSTSDSVNMFIDEVTVIDYAYYDPEKGFVGNSLFVDAELIGHLDSDGVIFDFSHTKKRIKEVIDTCCDHRLVLPTRLVDTRVETKDSISLEITTPHSGKTSYTCPEQGICLIDSPNISQQSIKTYLKEQSLAALPDNVLSLRLTLREENFPANQPRYHYTHGLKQHHGNCQRLFHGHRNKLDIYIDGAKSWEFEQRIAREWSNIHLAFPENLKNDDYVVGSRQQHLDHVDIAYVSSQGRFEARIPGRDVYVMPFETTVENIARHLAEKIKAEKPRARVRVRAYEGIRKGTEATA